MNLKPRAQETLYFRNQAGVLYYQPAGYVRLAWGAERPTLDVIKTFYEQVLSLLVNTGSHKILSDHGNRSPLPGPAQQWIVENWIPRALSLARTRHCAIVDGADPLHRLSAQSVVSAAPTEFVFRRFATVEAAEAWLLSVAV